MNKEGKIRLSTPRERQILFEGYMENISKPAGEGIKSVCFIGLIISIAFAGYYDGFYGTFAALAALCSGFMTYFHYYPRDEVRKSYMLSFSQKWLTDCHVADKMKKRIIQLEEQLKENGIKPKTEEHDYYEEDDDFQWNLFNATSFITRF